MAEVEEVEDKMDSDFQKDFQIRIYHDEGCLMVEVSKIRDIKFLLWLINHLERLRE